MSRTAAIVLALAIASAPTLAQRPIPVRQLAPITTRTTEHLGGVAGMWQYSNGRILVNDGIHFRLLMFDSSLAHSSVVADSNAGVKYQRMPVPLIPFKPDSALFIDINGPAQLFVLIGPDGTVARSIAPPTPDDVQYLVNLRFGSGVVDGKPLSDGGIDAKGRLVYRGMFPPPPRKALGPGQLLVDSPPDSSPLMRSDFATRSIDTVAHVRIRNRLTTKTLQTDSGVKMTIVLNPVQVSDEWAVFPDGTIAIVRSHDYHVDWIDPDGHTRSTPKMPYDWRRLTDGEKQVMADSQLALYQKSLADALKGYPKDRKPPALPVLESQPLNDIPEYLSPAVTVRADRDGNLWILTSTSLHAGTGSVYDVVNRQGAIVERVQVPRGSAIAGFGPGGTVYVTIADGEGGVFLGRTRVSGAPAP